MRQHSSSRCMTGLAKGSTRPTSKQQKRFSTLSDSPDIARPEHSRRTKRHLITLPSGSALREFELLWRFAPCLALVSDLLLARSAEVGSLSSKSVSGRLGSSVARCRVGPATEYDRRLRPYLIGVAIP